AYLELRAPPQPMHRLLPGMFELHEEVVARRRAAGTQHWYINIGLASPPVPSPAGRVREQGGTDP
ncbi:MAG: hypothetical protein ACREFT_14515, partial [Acetobacteraceae bacterium]